MGDFLDKIAVDRSFWATVSNHHYHGSELKVSAAKVLSVTEGNYYRALSVSYTSLIMASKVFLWSFLGLVVLLLHWGAAPPLLTGAVMVLAGLAWGVYSLLGKKSSSALLSTSGNFVYAAFFCVPLVGVVCFVGADNFVLDSEGVYYALASGVFASGCGYAIWYSALPLIKSTTAATVQLSVPVIASLMGWIALGEPLTMQILVASIATLGGIYLVIKK